MQLKSQKDMVTGLVFLTAGIAYGVASGGYEIGSALAMGPGYFPLLLSVALAVIGAVIATLSLLGTFRPEDRLERPSLRPVLSVLAAMAIFGLLLGGVPSLGIPPMGLLAALVGLVFVVGLARPSPRLVELCITAAALAVMCYLIFSVLLNIGVPFFPQFL